MSMRIETTSNETITTFDSVNEFADAALMHLDEAADEGLTRSWHGVDSEEALRKLVTHGWAREANAALEVAREAIDTVEREHEMTGFQAVWDVAGCEVDVARYLAREPENMIDYQITPTTRAGRVIVLCASVAYSSAVEVKSIKKRGQQIAALAFALSELGYQTELWADMSIGDNTTEWGGRATVHGRVRFLVKGANDEVDAAAIMYAYCHPSVFRVLGFGAMHDFPERFHRPLSVGGLYGYPCNPKQDLPEGTIYLPHLLSGVDVPDADKFLLKHMRGLGIITD